MPENPDEGNDANLLPDKVRYQENDDENVDEQIVEAKTAEARVSRSESVNDGWGHDWSAEDCQIRAY
jgi:hypothetical protein